MANLLGTKGMIGIVAALKMEATKTAFPADHQHPILILEFNTKQVSRPINIQSCKRLGQLVSRPQMRGFFKKFDKKNPKETQKAIYNGPLPFSFFIFYSFHVFKVFPPAKESTQASSKLILCRWHKSAGTVGSISADGHTFKKTASGQKAT